MVKFLKKLKARRPEGSVRYMLHSHLTGYQPGRSRRIVHASDMTKEAEFCPRAFALADVTKAKAEDEWLSTSQIMTFQIGRDQEKNLVHWFADMGKALCTWKCVNCNHLHEFQLRPQSCKKCGCTRFDHQELRFESAISGGSCGLDMVLALGEPLMRYVEIKTMDKEQFKELKAPLAEHRWRTNLGLRLIAESALSWSNMIATDKATILYVSKGGFGCAAPDLRGWGLYDDFSPFKEYTVERDDAETDEIQAKAKAVKDFRAELVGMPCGVCKTALGKRAKECSMRVACFSGDHPAEHDWSK